MPALREGFAVEDVDWLDDVELEVEDEEWLDDVRGGLVGGDLDWLEAVGPLGEPMNELGVLACVHTNAGVGPAVGRTVERDGLRGF